MCTGKICPELSLLLDLAVVGTYTTRAELGLQTQGSRVFPCPCEVRTVWLLSIKRGKEFYLPRKPVVIDQLAFVCC